ncbi:unnamed protein product [Adineta ricciae]|uniref:Rab-GAP TBC domain-containing protein n=1 Tax=Adineta ricciae TaxID=249248 RepID=A0A814N2W3_ADIRI|nr:unnamed protein product [Adineta ricciae]CAF1273508.1 unnamed protein product [Adineta ricciae]
MLKVSQQSKGNFENNRQFQVISYPDENVSLNSIFPQGWDRLSTAINAANDEKLRKFIDLSASEQQCVLAEIRRQWKTMFTEESNSFLIENFAELLVSAGSSSQVSPKHDYLTEISNDMITLLRNWSNEKSKFYAFFNRPLSQPIRSISWHLYLSNANYPEKFRDDLSNHPQSVLSPMDMEIHDKCDYFISFLPCASEIQKSLQTVQAMKAILSYYRSQFIDQRNLTQAEYYYLIPIVYVQQTDLSKSLETFLSDSIEMYQTFIDTLPKPLKYIHLNNSIETFDLWFEKVEYHLNRIDPFIWNHIQTVLQNNLVSRSQCMKNDVLYFLRKSCSSWFHYMFINCLTMDTLLFVWDQYLITKDLPNFYDELLPAVTTAIIVILKDFIVECKKTSEIERILKTKPALIETYQFQSTFSRFFLVNSPSKTIVIRPTRINQSTNPVHDLLTRITKTFNLVTHGEGTKRAELDRRTTSTIRTYRFDLMMSKFHCSSSKESELQIAIKRVQTRYLMDQNAPLFSDLR